MWDFIQDHDRKTRVAGDGTRPDEAAALARQPVPYWLRTAALLALVLTLLLHPVSTAQFMSIAALLLYLRAGQIQRTRPTAQHCVNWLRMDVIMYAGVIAATGGAGSPVLAFLLLPVAMLGIAEGLGIALAAALTVSAVFLFEASEASTGRTIMHWPPAVIFLPSIILALLLWVRSQVTAQQGAHKLDALAGALRECTDDSDFAALISAEMRAACNADACLVTVVKRHSTDWHMAYALPHCGETVHADCTLADIPAPLRQLLSSLTLFTSSSRSRWSPPLYTILEPFSAGDAEHDAAIATAHRFFGRRSLASFPLLARGRALGRVILMSRDPISAPMVRQMFQVGVSAALMMENAWLREQEGPGAQRSRRTISRDIHDGVIQPILGLKMGLEALKNKAGSALLTDLNELISMTDQGVQELRQYTGALRNGGRRTTSADNRSLLELLRDQADSFSRHHGIPTNVMAESIDEVDGSLHDEVIYIVKEGLSNIRRHSQSESATIRLKTRRGRLLIELLNDDRTDRLGNAGFFPRSIGERAADLGGSIAVQRSPEGQTLVEVDLPLEAR